MQPTLANNENRPSSSTASETSNSNDRRPGGTSIASEVSRLFPTFRSVNGGQQSRQSSQRGVLVNSRRRRPLGTDHNRKIINKKKKKQRSRIIHKDVIFVSDAFQTKVPTHRTRLALEKKGRVIHDFPFKTDWDQFELRAAVERELPVLATRDYEFLKVIHWLSSRKTCMTDICSCTF